MTRVRALPLFLLGMLMAGTGVLPAANSAGSMTSGGEATRLRTTSTGVLEDWAAAWSSHDSSKVLALFTNDCVYEDVTFGVVTHGKEELKGFADGTFAAVPDFKVELTSMFSADGRAGMEWVMSGTHKGDFPGLPATGKAFGAVRGATILE